LAAPSATLAGLTCQPRFRHPTVEKNLAGIVASQLYAHAFPRQVQDAAITLNGVPGSRCQNA
jgi:hypothetical protein